MSINLRGNSRLPRLALGLIGLGLLAASLFVGCRRNLRPSGTQAASSLPASGSDPGNSSGSCPHHDAGGGCGMESGSGCSHMSGKEAPESSPQVPVPVRPQGADALAWSLPDGWSEETGTGMRIATLRSTRNPSVEITIIALEGTAGGELANVNRWREQIGLPPVDAAGLGSTRKKVASKAGEIVVHELLNPTGNGIIAATVAPSVGHTWFLKMAGDTPSLIHVRDSFFRWLVNLRIGGIKYSGLISRQSTEL